MSCLEMLFWFFNYLPHDDLYRSVVQHMLNNIHEVIPLNIYELAEMCYTSPATISRLVKKLGYSSYAAFKTSLEDALIQYEYHNRHIPLQDMKSDTDNVLDLLDTRENLMNDFRSNYQEERFIEIARMLRQSKHVVLCSLFRGPSEQFLQSNLVMSGISCDLIDEMISLDALSELNEGSLVVFSHPKRIDTGKVKEIVKYVKTKKAKIIVITNSHHFSIINDADLSYIFNGTLHMMDMHIFQTILAAIDIKYRAMYMH